MADLEQIKKKLSTIHKYSDSELDIIMPKLEEIDRIRKAKHAVILAHYYQIPPIQLIADKAGDSLALASYAKALPNEISLIVTSTVYFMAEMVKSMCPGKKVVIPDPKAGCSIADGMNVNALRKIRENYPKAAIVAYINTTAEVKSEVDAVCTSANASTILSNIEGNPVILLPDYFFSKNIMTA